MAYGQLMGIFVDLAIEISWESVFDKYLDNLKSLYSQKGFG